MKKFVSMFLALAMCLTLAAPAWAVEEGVPAEVDSRVIYNEEYSFFVFETKNSNNQVTRIYTSDQTTSKTRTSGTGIEQTKAVLSELGINQTVIDNMSAEQLKMYSSCPEICNTVSYIKITDTANEYIDKETALRESSVINTRRLANAQSINESGEKTETTSYMELTYTVAYKGNAQYEFTTSAKWLSMPVFRGTDSLGSCSTDMSTTPGSGKVSYSYSVTTYLPGNITTKNNQTEDIFASKIEEPINESWTGSGVLFKMPLDDLNPDGTIYRMYTNLCVTFSYSGHIRDYTSPKYFNTAGTYTHTKIGIDIKPSLTIGLSGGKGSIGISTVKTKDTVTALLELHYYPLSSI